jgi:hypothetical protein
VSDRIVSQPSNDAYRENWERIWGKRPRLAVSNQPCPTCKGEGWLMDKEGEPCPDCQHPEFLGGTGYVQRR